MNLFFKFYLLIIVGLTLVLSTSSCVRMGSYDFLTTKPFFFYQVGNTVEFRLNISDARYYELALETEEEIFPLKVMEMQPFQWELEVSTWLDNELLDKQVLGKSEAGMFLGDGFEYFKELSMGIIPKLRSRFFSKTFYVKVVVKKIDDRYIDEKLPVIVGIRPSPHE